MVEQIKFNKIEQTIMTIMYQQRVALTIYEIAKECDISYMTAKKYCLILTTKGILNYVADRNSIVILITTVLYGASMSYEEHLTNTWGS